MNNHKTIFLPLLLLSIVFSSSCYAGAKQAVQGPLSLRISLGNLSGQSGEYLYNDGMKVSQLNWSIKNAAIANGELNYDFLSWLSLNGRGWVTLAKNRAPMDDWDWRFPNQSSWTDWSHHENNHLNHANEINLDVRTWFMQGDGYKLGFVTGYQRSVFSWTVQGSYYYTNPRGNHFRSLPGDQLVGGYQQKFSVPYVGLAGKYVIDKFEFGALLKFSEWVDARAHDEHYLRRLTTKSRGSNAEYYAATLDAGYYIARHAKIFAEGNYNLYSQAIGDGEAISRDSGRRDDSFNDTVFGTRHKNYAFSFGLQYFFD